MPFPHSFNMKKPVVLIIQENLPHYRVSFFDQLRKDLSAHGVSLELIFSPKTRDSLLPGYLPWATSVPIHWLGPLGWQNVFPYLKDVSLVIAPQEAKYAVIPLLMILRRWGGWKFAFWGHGKNFQSFRPNSLSERWKRFLSRRADWWFAYNNLSARIVRDLGFPATKTTVVMNSIDTRLIINARKDLSLLQLSTIRKDLGIRSENIAIYTGGLYSQKRIPFLIEACRQVRILIPDFEMIIIGKGPDENLVREAVKSDPWFHYVGPKDNLEKIPYWGLSKICLMPGLVGLVVLDSFAFGVPMITTDYPYHSPEIDYLVHNKNGVVVDAWQDCKTYAYQVARLLTDEHRRSLLAQEGQAALKLFSVEQMAKNFSKGVLCCLEVV